MNKHELKAERLRILREETALYHRSEAGEDVTKELLACGRELDKLGRKKHRKDVGGTTFKGEKQHNLDVVITDAMYKRAASVGVGRQTLRQRIYRDGWDVERALSKPKGRAQKSDAKGMTVDGYKHLKEEGLRDSDICAKYGIKRYVLHQFKQKHGFTKSRVGVSV